MKIETLRHAARHAWSSLCGVVRGRASPRLIAERMRFTLTRRVGHFMERGFPIDDAQSLVAWWEIVVEARLLAGVRYVPRRVLDVGANYGVFGWAVKDRWPGARLIGVEPRSEWLRVPHLYERVFSCALGRNTGRVKLWRVDNEGATATTCPGIYPVRDAVEVPCVPLDQLTLGKFDLVKIDVDGAETEILQGGIETLKVATVVIVEINSFSALTAYRGALGEGTKVTHNDWMFTP